MAAASSVEHASKRKMILIEEDEESRPASPLQAPHLEDVMEDLLDPALEDLLAGDAEQADATAAAPAVTSGAFAPLRVEDPAPVPEFKSYRWTWTSYQLEPPAWNPEWMSYLVHGLETCPTTGRIHHQGYLETKARLRFRTLLSKPGWNLIHVRSSRGSAQQNRTYCVKDGVFTEHGAISQTEQPGGKNGAVVARLAKEVLEGKTTVEDIVRETAGAYHLFGRTLEKAEAIRARSMQRAAWAPPAVIWYWGAPGCGKSRRAREQAQEMIETARADGTEIGDDGIMDLYVHDFDDKGWWDLYCGEKIVLFEEYRGQFTWSSLLRYLDGYRCNVSQRGKKPFPFLAKVIYITSCKHPKDCYSAEVVGENIDQLLRRITRVIHFDKL